MAEKATKVTIKSNLDRIIVHNGLEIMPLETLSVSKEVADHLIKLGYCEAIKAREV